MQGDIVQSIVDASKCGVDIQFLKGYSVVLAGKVDVISNRIQSEWI